MAILVTGGAGFIGSHTVVELQNAGYDVVVLDNLSNSSEKSLERVEKITGKPVKFYKKDILDREGLNEVFEKEDIDSCIHFAGLKAVGESVVKPWEYYENNIAGTLTLVDVMRKHGVKNIIFSSSATVYGDPAIIPITEECPKGQCTNPYGWTKSMLEQILTDILKADPEWNVVLLRNITCTTWFDRVRNFDSCRSFKILNDVKDAVSFACSQIVNTESGIIFQFLNCFYMPLCKVNNMNVISHSGSIRCIIIITKYSKLFQLTNCNLCDIWHQVVRNTIRILTDKATLMSTNRIEVTKKYYIPFWICFLDICKNLFQHGFGPAIRIGAL